MAIKNIGVIGVGGVGGYFGGKLCRGGSAESDVSVSFIARGEHLRVIAQLGLLLESEADGLQVCTPALATDDFRRLPRLDLCLLCVKEFDLAGALVELKAAIGAETVLLPLLNGVDVPARIRKVITQGVVLPACVYVGTHREKPGKVVQKGGACKVLFGPDPRRPEFSPVELNAVFRQAGIKTEWTAEVQTEIWKKFVFICAYGLTSAAAGKTLGQILDDRALSDEVRTIMTEVVSLAHGTGVRLPAAIVEESYLKARGFPYEAKTSFQRDFERFDQRDERDLFAGAMLTMADELGIAIPKTREVASRLEDIKPARSARMPPS